MFLVDLVCVKCMTLDAMDMSQFTAPDLPLTSLGQGSVCVFGGERVCGCHFHVLIARPVSLYHVSDTRYMNN